MEQHHTGQDRGSLQALWTHWLHGCVRGLSSSNSTRAHQLNTSMKWGKTTSSTTGHSRNTQTANRHLIVALSEPKAHTLYTHNIVSSRFISFMESHGLAQTGNNFCAHCIIKPTILVFSIRFAPPDFNSHGSKFKSLSRLTIANGALSSVCLEILHVDCFRIHGLSVLKVMQAVLRSELRCTALDRLIDGLFCCWKQCTIRQFPL
jgi:hypothetical protein